MPAANSIDSQVSRRNSGRAFVPPMRWRPIGNSTTTAQTTIAPLATSKVSQSKYFRKAPASPWTRAPVSPGNAMASSAQAAITAWSR